MGFEGLWWYGREVGKMPGVDLLRRLETWKPRYPPQDVLIRQGGQVIRLGLDLSDLSVVNREGITVPHTGVES